MNIIGAYWQTLGTAIEAGIRDRGGLDAAFPELAAGVLKAHPAPAMNANAIADWMIEKGTLPEQVNFHSGFGEPPLVVYAGADFYIEVLFWFPGPTAIHGHGFTGAFVVLDGMSIQVEYTFEEREAPEESVRLGQLIPQSLEFIAPGKVCPIVAGTGFIHAVTHLGNPSLTLVVRTFGHPARPQYRYHRSGFAVLSGVRRQIVMRQAEVLAAVYEAAPAELAGRLVRFLEGVKDGQFYSVLEALLGILRAPIFTQRVLPVIETHFAVTRPAVMAAVRERVRTRNIWLTARHLPKLSAQVQCALADLVPDPFERDALICRSYGVTSLENLPPPWRDLVRTVDRPPAQET